MLIDSCFQTYRHGYALTQVHHHRGHVLRVHVRRDHVASQSFALVEVLTPQWTWTELATDIPARLHAATPEAQSADEQALTAIAEALLQRAAAVLTPPEPAG